MSLESWKEEFYPVKASKITDRKEALEHSLRKWKGLTEDNLNKHSVRLSGDCLYDDKNKISIDSHTCALCILYFKPFRGVACIGCPILKVLGGVSCDYFDDGPYQTFLGEKDPASMIDVLEECLKREKYDSK